MTDSTAPGGTFAAEAFKVPENTGKNTRIIAACNKSGGSVKTTSVTALAAEAARLKLKVLVIDADDQRDASHILGYDDPDQDENLLTLWDVVDGLGTLEEAIVPARMGEGGEPIPNLWLVPASRELDNFDLNMAGEQAREMWLMKHIQFVRGRFDVVFIDCPGDLKLIVTGVLLCTDEVMACVKSQEKEIRALTELESKIASIREDFKYLSNLPELRWIVVGEGVTDKGQGKVYQQAEDQLRAAYGEMVLKPTVRRSVRVPGAYSAQIPLTLFAPKEDASLEYKEIAKSMGLFKKAA
ncbi:ParA family protein [Streptomyces sp. NPDC085665]|uniref:ParA family protein n=1 Tax=Streptomyces sp. NPDC085665 TaxID=3365735 RepID=UPI0037D5E6AE